MELLEIVREAEERLAPLFARLDKVAESGTAKVMAAFREERVSNGMFASTDGYGYDDRGRDVLDKLYARVFDAEASFVRSSVLSGTHALAIGLFGRCNPLLFVYPLLYLVGKIVYIDYSFCYSGLV